MNDRTLLNQYIWIVWSLTTRFECYRHPISQKSTNVGASCTTLPFSKFSGVLAARQHISPFVGIGTDLPPATSIYMKINPSCLSSETGIV